MEAYIAKCLVELITKDKRLYNMCLNFLQLYIDYEAYGINWIHISF